MSAPDEDNDVFISYQWDIKPQVIEVCNELKKYFKIWRDGDGLRHNTETLNQQLANAIRKSKIFLCFLTQNYAESKICKREIKYSSEYEKTIIILDVEKISIDTLDAEIGFIISGLPRINCYKNSNWASQNLEEIKKAIEDNLEELTKKKPINKDLILNRYKIVKKLGEGAQSEVFLVEDVLKDNKRKAMKKFKDLGINKQAMDNEVKLTRNIKHDNVIEYYDFHSVSQQNYFGNYFIHVMLTQYYEDGSLNDKIKLNKINNCEFNYTKKIAWCMQLIDAISYLHKLNIIHRDINPRRDLNHLVLGDLGHAKRIEIETNKSYKSISRSMLFGTISYNAPEVLNNNYDANYETKFDIWSFGCTVYEIQQQKVLFNGKILDQINNFEFKSLNLNKDEPIINKLIEMSLIKDPKDRADPIQLLKIAKGLFSNEKILSNKNKNQVKFEQNVVKLEGIMLKNKIKVEKTAVNNDDKYVGELLNNRKNGKGQMSYSNGDTYNGEWKDDKRSGKGQMIYSNGDKYDGKWMGDKQNGKGFMFLTNGEKYAGVWKDGKRDGKGQMIYSNGDKYNGEWKDDKKNGNGIFTWINGDKYDGEWKDGKKNGNGIITWKDGDKYVGEWKEDKRNGKGQMSYSNGDKYNGEWKDSLRHGKGIFTKKIFLWLKDKYDGEWRDDKKNGRGVKTWSNGDKYDGEWKDGLRHGKGVQYFANGDKYDGEWENDKKNGIGIKTWANGAKYDGEWKEGKINGKGIQYSANGDKYDGEWIDDKKNGKGIFTGTNGDKYDGKWKNDKANGKGIMYLANGDRYDGEWKDGKSNGKGIFSWANGDKYEGDLVDGKINGKGIQYSVNGEIYDGEWKDGKKNGKGLFTWIDGAKYDGEWKDDKKNGKGIFTWADGAKYDGEWKDGKKNGKGVYYFANGLIESQEWINGTRIK